MKDCKTLAHLSIETLVDRGMDFLVKEANTFVKDQNLHEFSKSQIYGLRSEIDKIDNFADLEAGMKAWLKNQAEKRAGEKWKKIRDKLLSKMFEWDKDRIDNIKKLAQKTFDEKEIISRDINKLLTEQNLTEDLKFQLARRFFYAVLTLYRCCEDEEIRKKLEEMQL